ncbi:putative arsenite efflux transporter protein [Botrytis cinerea BcDW1]|uniref:Putative arsenite efflux transporter protein n=1 Tax=Botryotinia fuckeliana (strain BcDW1) TaxID=1290391 RepID=M7TFZ5_BOTF1|nr:putative arsenite efflux transporter protein [Botrytis cinerea BcDW1]
MTKVLASEDIVSPESTNQFPRSSSDVPSHSIDIEKNSHLQDPSEPQNGFQTDHQKTSLFKSLGWLDRLLALWIFLAMAIGILLGNFVPNVGTALQKGEFVGLALAWAFLPDKEELRSGLILVGIARCIAMVLIWTGLAGGSTSYCAILVAINSLLQMVLFAPLSVLFISVISGAEGPAEFSYSTIASSVAVFLGIPLAAAILTRFLLRRLTSPSWYDTVFLKYLSPLSLLGLLATILILFASQGQHVIQQIVSVVRVAAPLVVYFAIIFFLTLFVCARMGFGYKVATTQSFTAASNNFELAIAVAVATYGADSEQALAATVGPLIEVPVLLGLVYVVRWIGERRGWKD